MKPVYLMLAIVLLAGAGNAAVLKVASDGTQPYLQIQDAVTASSANDTILIMAGSYTGFTVDRKLVVIGSGTGLGIGEGVLVGGVVTVTGEADSSELRSLWVRSTNSHQTQDSLSSVLRILSGATHIFVWRCYVENLTAAFYGSCAFVGTGSSADLVQCIFSLTQSASSNHYGIMQRPGSMITMSSCVISGAAYSFYRYGTCAGAFVTVNNSIFTCNGANTYPFYTEATGVAENCAFLSSSGANQIYSSAANMVYSYCAASQVVAPGTTNFLASNPALVNLLLTDPRGSDYHLAAGSNLVDAGNPGSPDDLDGSRCDIGIYGGQHPFVEGGIPDYPFAVQVEVPYTAPLNGTMRIWARGRVGPGY